MHVPDGFINAPISLAAGVIAAGGLALCLRGARKELDDKTAPLAGLVAAFVFAVQMVNFPVAVGTSGHLMGGVLAAVLVGPYTGVLCVSVVLIVQALFFADGGLSALGVNIILMALVTALVGYAVVVALQKVLPDRRSSMVPASVVGAFVSVPVGALVFVLLFALGGTADLPLGTVLSGMLGVHVLIGIGEAIITGLTVGSVLAVRPDLVYAARRYEQQLDVRTTGAR